MHIQYMKKIIKEYLYIVLTPQLPQSGGGSAPIHTHTVQHLATLVCLIGSKW